MSREERLKLFLDSVDAKFNAHNTQESFVKSMEKIFDGCPIIRYNIPYRLRD